MCASTPKATLDQGQYNRSAAFETALRGFPQTANVDRSEWTSARDILCKAAQDGLLTELDLYLRTRGFPQGLEPDDFCAAIPNNRFHGKGRYVFYFDDPTGIIARNVMTFLSKKDKTFTPNTLSARLRYCTPVQLAEIFSPTYWFPENRQKALRALCNTLRSEMPNTPAANMAEALSTRLKNPEESGLLVVPSDGGRKSVIDLSIDHKKLALELQGFLARRFSSGNGGDSTALLDFGGEATRAFSDIQKHVFDPVNAQNGNNESTLRNDFSEILEKLKALSSDAGSWFFRVPLIGPLCELLLQPDVKTVQAISTALNRLEKKFPAEIERTRQEANRMDKAARTFGAFAGYFNACAGLIDDASQKLHSRMDQWTMREFASHWENFNRLALVAAGAEQTAQTIGQNMHQMAIEFSQTQSTGLGTARTAVARARTRGYLKREEARTAFTESLQALAFAGERSLLALDKSWEDARRSIGEPLRLPAPLTPYTVPLLSEPGR